MPETIRLTIGKMSDPVFIDPVCRMQVQKSGAADVLLYADKNHYFCNSMCAVKFSRDPDFYLTGKSSLTDSPAEIVEDLDEETLWTCPMHPEILEKSQTPCPLCGMALDPLEPTLTAGPDPELLDMTRRFKLSLAFTVPLICISMQEMVGSPLKISAVMQETICMLLATPVVCWLGLPFFERFVSSIKARSPNMYTLIGSGVAVAYIYSLVRLLTEYLTPTAHTAVPGGHQTLAYFEPAAAIITLSLAGQVLELKARQATSRALQDLIAVTPAQAHFVKIDGNTVTIDAARLIARDVVRIRPGELIPADALVLEGASTVDQSMLTGESAPVEKAAGDIVYGGTTNHHGSLLARVTHAGKKTVLAGIIRLVSEAQRSRAPVQQTVDRVASFFMPVVFAVALASYFYWSHAQNYMAQTDLALTCAIASLVIACPCALGLATPMAITVIMGAAAKRGILVKDASTLETFSRVDTVIFDKTGTLTEGRPRLVADILLPGATIDADTALALAAAVEGSSEHPIARAISSAAKDRQRIIHQSTKYRTSDFVYEPGRGVSAVVSLLEANETGGRDYRVTVGSAIALANGPRASSLEEFVAANRRCTPLVVTIDERDTLLLALRDNLKDDARETVAALQKLGMQCRLFSGDCLDAVEEIASQCDISDFEAAMSPARKQACVAKLVEEGKVVAMVGDGINDAPALARAHVGIAMSTGTVLAMQSAGIVILAGQLDRLPQARRLSEIMSINIKQNLWLAFGYNLLALPLAAGVLYPVCGLLLSPMIASAAMALSSLSVIGNALRAGRCRI